MNNINASGILVIMYLLEYIVRVNRNNNAKKYYLMILIGQVNHIGHLAMTHAVRQKDYKPLLTPTCVRQSFN